MLDKIVRIDRHNALMIYSDGRVVSLYSSDNVNDIIIIMLQPLSVNSSSLESYCHSLDDTCSIDITKAG